ncbi:hypothetical protein MHLP_03765 [Candidatus Mycoplasma haematolamae str. Purdue]|uniref:Uncharacterized protein n=1 Tax=Mycoplasma haematolamae (strain Purdue) TaxID=1212765 RepID=I7BKC2_MYCHA|nr:hypothetical protein [Candidatus Mycoplasma haematolamae]AFO52333.1 hypothetical protein MHLP_03765 [Candidatus Mycoplasma haematolamae str. Purdue]
MSLAYTLLFGLLGTGGLAGAGWGIYEGAQYLIQISKGAAASESDCCKECKCVEKEKCTTECKCEEENAQCCQKPDGTCCCCKKPGEESCPQGQQCCCQCTGAG